MPGPAGSAVRGHEHDPLSNRPASLGNRYGLEIRAAGSQEAAGVSGVAGHGRDRPRAARSRAAPGRDPPGRRDRAAGAGVGATEWNCGCCTWVSHRAVRGPRGRTVSLLLVAPDERRRGIGRLLVKAAAQAARSAGCDNPGGGPPPSSSPILPASASPPGFAAAGAGYVRPAAQGRLRAQLSRLCAWRPMASSKAAAFQLSASARSVKAALAFRGQAAKRRVAVEVGRERIAFRAGCNGVGPPGFRTAARPRATRAGPGTARGSCGCGRPSSIARP